MDTAPTTDLVVERTGTRRYVGTSTRGARVEVGDAGTEGVFTPGELLKIALAACTAMASDPAVARRLGEDFRAEVHVSGDADRTEEVYSELRELYAVDLGELDPSERDRLEQVLRRAVDRSCTVGRTLGRGTRVTLDIVDTSADRRRGTTTADDDH